MKIGVTLFAVLFAVFMMAGCGTGKADNRHDNLETDKGIILLSNESSGCEADIWRMLRGSG